MRPMSDAEQRYVEAVSEDCRRILGTGVELVDLEIDEAPSSTRLVITYRLDGWEGRTEATGPTVIEAHTAAREALIVDRVKLGFSALTDPRTLDPTG